QSRICVVNSCMAGSFAGGSDVGRGRAAGPGGAGAEGDADHGHSQSPGMKKTPKRGSSRDHLMEEAYLP
ncbi:hypothetical protein, partial [Rhodovulum sulfidophilum]|uniref:hypothetical protein n=1 Tax=Rhodovulum sulfidophilum TaxID=35806 RepID=UPI001F23BAC2